MIIDSNLNERQKLEKTLEVIAGEVTRFNHLPQVKEQLIKAGYYAIRRFTPDPEEQCDYNELWEKMLGDENDRI